MIIKIDIACDDLERLVALMEDTADVCDDMAAQLEDDEAYEEEMTSHLEEAANYRRLIGYMETCIRHAHSRPFPGFSCN